MTAISPELGLGTVAPPLEDSGPGSAPSALGAPPSNPRAQGCPAGPAGEARRAAAARPLSFEDAYDQLFDFVWRSLRRLGVPAASIDDAVQDVFVVVHRRLADFEGRSSLKTWAFAIALRVARDHQRRVRRKGSHEPLDMRIPDEAPGPIEHLARCEAVRELDRILGTLDEDKRAVFVLVEIEQLSAPEAAAALGVNVNTVYSRLRAARREVEAALPRLGELSE